MSTVAERSNDILDTVEDIEYHIEQITWHRKQIADEFVSMRKMQELLKELGENYPNEWLCSHGVRWDFCPDCSH